MKDPSKTYCQATSNPSPSATSSPESASGPMPSDKPDGPTIEKSGPEVVPANLSAQQAREQGLLTSGTYGPRFITSSGSVRLEQSLVSKLQAKTALLGSGLFRLTWKQRDTPSGVSIFALRASARRTSVKDCTLSDPAHWSTPRANKWGFPDAHGSHERPIAASWPTPTGLSPAKNGQNEAGNSCNLVKMKALVSGWPTTTTRDWKDGSACPNVPLNSLRDRVVWLTDTGAELTGSSAKTKSIGQLNPALPRWLQGLPIAWESCADMVTPLRRQSRKVSSKPI